MVDPLSQQLNWGNGAALVHLRQVQVVYKDDALLAHGRSEHPLPPPIQLGHNDV